MTTISDIDKALHGLLDAINSWNHSGYRKLAEDELVANAKTREADVLKLDGLLESCTQVHKQLYRVRAHVVAELNSYVAVDRLPDDVLALVFEHHDQDALYFRKYNGRRDQWPIHPTITVSSVCARWRAVALAHPVLWSRIDLHASQAHVGLLVERAKCHPMRLILCDDDNGTSWSKEFTDTRVMAEVLKAHLSRVWSLDINLRSAPGYLIDILINTQAPLLEELSLARLSLCGTIFGGVALQVRKLSLRDVKITWTSGLFANLSSLSVSGKGILFEPETDICNLLRLSPHLESLCLKNCQHWESALMLHEHPCTPRTELARLHTLTLALPIKIIHHVLSSFGTPSLHSVVLTPDDIYIENDSWNLSPRLPWLPSLCTPGMLPRALFAPLAHVHATALEQQAAGRFRHKLESTVRAASVDDTHTFVLSWTLSDDVPERIHAAAAAIADNLTTHYLSAATRALTLSSGFARRDHTLAPLLRAHALRTLTLEGRAAARSVLAAAFVEGAAASVRADLRELVLRCLEVDQDALRTVLAWCRMPDRRLERMAFEDVKFMPSREAVEGILDELRGVVPCVYVSGAIEAP
ncbi:hypothetical protein PsYK624_050930 [Phanerochaete sordida]|uniref:F-box domain-containing protein n=1 Tax=Phanerochaete sordida TaxID=48140 RepID=A0A9P3LBY1_9APHY|nr:hypothetical protein PsYK624_050930 [Phanerochaete sordida]